MTAPLTRSGEESATADATRADETTALLRIEDLSVEFGSRHGRVRAVDGLSLFVREGETLAIVGESGSGKSVTALSVMRLLPQRIAQYAGGRIFFDGAELLGLPDRQMERLRGHDIAMIFQEPMTSLNPILTIGYQIMEPLKTHMGMDNAAARKRAAELLELVGIPDVDRRLDQYPHQFSGGMRQRVMIAIGLACNPKLIIADEPTTALDVTIQAQILELMKDLSRRLGIALILITHNLGIVARYADRIAVMYAARIVEQGKAETVFSRPRHPYTMGLLRSVPRLDRARLTRLATIEGLPPNLADVPSGCRFAPRCPHRIEICGQDPALALTDVDTQSACWRHQEIAQGLIGADAFDEPPLPEANLDKTQPLLQVEGLSKAFSISAGFARRPGQVLAVDEVSLTVNSGETLGLVGESGCGKSTLGRLILGLETPTTGRIVYDGKDLAKLERKERQQARRDIQVIFQDPFSSLNPRMTVSQILSEPLRVFRLRKGAGVEARVSELLDQVGLRPEMADRYPHQLSGGQRQRVGIARALAMEPRVIVCDEAVSALDVSIQGQIINLLERLQRELGLTYLFIAHDLAVVRHISDRVAVMYLGRLMETAARDTLYDEPLHPYTRALLAAAPIPDPQIETGREAILVRGDVPSPLNKPSGCVFHTRCPMASAECREIVPPLAEKRPGHFAACIKI